MTRRETPLDAAAILHALAEHEVAYVVIGGMAVQAHGRMRSTQDLDVVPEPSDANLERLNAALAALDARKAGSPGPARAYEFPDSGTVALDTPAGAIDVHFQPPGAAPYPALRARALELDVAGVVVAVASREDLVAMKRASGRPVDRGDVIALTEPDRHE